MDFDTKVKQLPPGSNEVTYKNEKYLLNKEIFVGGKVIKVFARSLQSKDFISFNYYLTKNDNDLKPCEMSIKESYRFCDRY